MIRPQDKDAFAKGWYVDRQVYLSEDIFEQEKERIFYKTWYFACLTSDLKNPGDYFTMEVIDQPVLITHGQDGKLRAFNNSCTHRGAILNNERCGNERLFRCMYHAWAFSSEGELVAVPFEEGYGPDFDKKAFNLAPVKVDTFGDLVFVSVNPDVAPLREYLGEMIPRLDKYAHGIEVIGRNSWTYNGNWKFWHENFRDNYHPAFAHRTFGDGHMNYADYGGNWACAPGHSVLQWINGKHDQAQVWSRMTRYSEVEFPKGETVEYPPPTQEVLALFPNIDFQPGAQVDIGGGVMGSREGYIQVATPLSPHQTRIDILFFSSTEDDAKTRREQLENHANGQGSWGWISVDDNEAAVRCHMGVRGRSTKYSAVMRGVTDPTGKGGANADGVEPRDEYSLREFYRVYNLYLNGPDQPLRVAAE